MNWASQCEIGAYIVPLSSQSNPFLDNISSAPTVTEEIIEEAEFTLSKIGMIYTSSSASWRHSRVCTLLRFPVMD